jgi:hypothetical protein
MSASVPGTNATIWWMVGLGVVGFGLQAGCGLWPEWTERVYAQGIYPGIARGLVMLFGSWPFSVGEVLLLLGLGWVVLRVGRGLRAWRRGRCRFGVLLRRALAQGLAAFGLLFLLFQLLWGLNHARQPFAIRVGLVTREVGVQELARVAERLAERAAARRPEDGLVELQPGWREAVAAAYRVAGEQWAVLAGPPPPIRAPWISRLMIWSSITGIYSPFTGEPHVSADLPAALQPFVACHEVAHLRGYAREDEANFIAWWVGSRSADPELAYSCELAAFRHALARLSAVDRDLAERVWTRSPEPVRADVVAIRSFWEGQPRLVHRTLSAVSATVNDAYLRSSGHADGVRSYGRMVDLLVAALSDG